MNTILLSQKPKILLSTQTCVGTYVYNAGIWSKSVPEVPCVVCIWQELLLTLRAFYAFGHVVVSIFLRSNWGIQCTNFSKNRYPSLYLCTCSMNRNRRQKYAGIFIYGCKSAVEKDSLFTYHFSLNIVYRLVKVIELKK